MPQPSILILSSKFGEGHFKAGEALANMFETQLSSKVIVNHLDFGSIFLHKTDFFLRFSYLNMVTRTPSFWRWLYEKTTDLKLKGYRKFAQRIGSRALLNYIRKLKPDVIVCTHFFPAEVLAGFKKKGLLNVPLVTVVTDYLVHGVWVNSEIDLYLVGCEDASTKLIKAGVAPDKIVLSGIPVRACFDGDLAKATAKQKLGLKQNKMTVLIMGGISGLARKEIAILEALFNLAKMMPVQFLVICGSDKKFYKVLSAKEKDDEIKAGIFGYVDNIQEFMVAADLLITKGGALTISEAMTVGLPVIMYKPIPGHETGNAAFVESGGAGLMVHSSEELLRKVAYLLQNQSKLMEMSFVAQKMLPPHSAENGVNSILRLIND